MESPTSLTSQMKDEIVSRIVAVVHPIKIILFGSYAYGNPAEGSDLDLVVVKKKVVSKLRETREIIAALAGLRISKDVIVCEEAFFHAHSTPEWVNTALYDARTKGIVLYEEGRH